MSLTSPQQVGNKSVVSLQRNSGNDTTHQTQRNFARANLLRTWSTCNGFAMGKLRGNCCNGFWPLMNAINNATLLSKKLRIVREVGDNNNISTMPRSRVCGRKYFHTNANLFKWSLQQGGQKCPSNCEKCQYFAKIKIKLSFFVMRSTVRGTFGGAKKHRRKSRKKSLIIRLSPDTCYLRVS